jgi:uncharacterized protein YkwD
MCQCRTGAAEGEALAVAARSSRRRLLGYLVAAPVVLGLQSIASPPWAAAKKKKKKRKKRKRNTGAAVPPPSNASYSPDSEEHAFLALINDYRRQKGLRELSLNNELGAAAEFHSQDMATNNYFRHTLSNGDSSEKNIERHGYTEWIYIGENIAAGMTSASEVFLGWKLSPSHDQNMRNGHYAEIGIGRAYNANSEWGWYWTTTFGRE